MGIRRLGAPRVLLPVALLASYGVLQALYLRPPSAQDGMDYFERAAAWPDIARDHWSLRVGLLLPVRALQEIFGYSEAAYYGVLIVAAALLVLATFWLGNRLFGPAVGMAAAVVLMLNGVFLKSASIMQPDVPGAALFMGALVIVLKVAQEGNDDTWGRREHRLLVAAGLLLGWSYLIREFMVFAFPAVVAVFVFYRVPWRELLWVAGSAFTVFVGECLLNAVVYGSPFARFSVSGGHGGQRDYIHDSRLDALIRLPRALYETTGAAPLFVVFLLFVLAVFARDRSFRILGVWFVVFWLAVTLGTGLVVPSFRFFIADKLRYWMPVLPAVAIGGVAVAERTLTWVAARIRVHGRAAALVPGAMVVVLASVVGVVGSSDERARSHYRVTGADQLVDLRSWLASDGGDVSLIWTDEWTARLMPLYERSTFGGEVWSGKVRTYQHGARFVDRSALNRGAIVLYRYGYLILYRVTPLSVGSSRVDLQACKLEYSIVSPK